MELCVCVSKDFKVPGRDGVAWGTNAELRMSCQTRIVRGVWKEPGEVKKSLE